MQIFPVFIPNMGCPHRCVYCAQERSTAERSSLHPEKLMATFERLLPERGEGEIAFYGGTFTLLTDFLQRRLLDVANHFVQAGRVRGVRVSTRPDSLEDSLVARLAASGVTTVEVGCQSFCDTVLTLSGRGHAAHEAATAVERCRQAELRVGLQLMPGLPGSGAEEAHASLQAALRLSPDFLRLYPAVVLEGTELAERWRAGVYAPWSVDEAVEVCANLLLAARRADVPIVRMGLQQDPSLAANLLAGPHHPAFGQLVRSRLWRRALSRVLPAKGRLYVNPRDLSDAQGHARQNRHWFQEQWPEQSLVRDPTVPVGSLRSDHKEWPVEELAAEDMRYA